MQEMANPALSLDRARATWQKNGRSAKWIQQRMTGQETRNKGAGKNSLWKHPSKFPSLHCGIGCLRSEPDFVWGFWRAVEAAVLNRDLTPHTFPVFRRDAESAVCGPEEAAPR